MREGHSDGNDFGGSFGKELRFDDNPEVLPAIPELEAGLRKLAISLLNQAGDRFSGIEFTEIGFRYVIGRKSQ